MQAPYRALALIFVFVAACSQSSSATKSTTTGASPTTKNQSVDKAAGGAATAKPFEVAETAFTSSGDPTATVYTHWVAVIRNPNANAYGLFPVLRVTARDAAGKVLGTADQTLMELPPGVTIAFSSQLDLKQLPAKVEVLYSKIEWHDTDTRASDYKSFSAKGVTFEKVQFVGGLKIVGELTNPFPTAVDGMAVTALLRDASGRLLGGATTFTQVLPAAGTQPFELNADQPKATVKSVQVLAMPWGTTDTVAWNHLALGQPLSK